MRGKVVEADRDLRVADQDGGSVDEVAPEEQKMNQVKTGDLSEHPDVSAQRRHDASIPEGLFARSPIARYSSKVYQGAAGLWASAIGTYL
jgi:hypothetical protein